jgi:glycosyltransferase involved in cell wall biosynthesis
MRVLFVASSGELGGAELALDTYLAHLPADVEGHGVVVSPGPLAAAMAQRLGRPVATGDLAGRPSAARAAAFVRELRRTIAAIRPDVVHATGQKAAVLAAPAARLTRTPLVWHKVDFSRDRLLARPLATAVTGVIPVSAAIAATVPERRRLAVVPPPVRLDPGFRVSEPRPPATLGSVGRLVAYKGHADVIAAAARLPGARVLIAGGPDPGAPGHGDELRALAECEGVELELLGHVDNVQAVYERLTVLVQATYRDERGYGVEGFGAALAEAGWAGLPVVATMGGGAAEVVDDGVTGRLVAPRDVAGLATAIGAYLADPAQAARAGEAAAASTRERLAPAPLAQQLAEILRSV